MHKVQHKARLGERTVQMIARGEHVTPRARREGGGRPRHKAVSVRLHPLILAHLKSVGLKVTDVWVEGPESVLITNDVYR